MHKIVRTAAVAASLIALGSSAHAAYATFSATDANGNANVAIVPANSNAAEADFLSSLKSGVAVADFESQTAGAVAPLILQFVNSQTNAVTSATLAGGNGQVGFVDVSSGDQTDGQGRYSIGGGSKFWLVDASQSGNAFTISFSTAIAAFGFFATDVGDFGGSLGVDLLDDKGNAIQHFDVASLSGTDADGSALYFGVTSDATTFNAIRFSSASRAVDAFGFDRFTIATADQVNNPNNPMPEPGSVLLMGAAMAALGVARRRRS